MVEDIQQMGIVNVWSVLAGHTQKREAANAWVRPLSHDQRISPSIVVLTTMGAMMAVSTYPMIYLPSSLWYYGDLFLCQKGCSVEHGCCCCTASSPACKVLVNQQPVSGREFNTNSSIVELQWLDKSAYLSSISPLSSLSPPSLSFDNLDIFVSCFQLLHLCIWHNRFNGVQQFVRVQDNRHSKHLQHYLLLFFNGHLHWLHSCTYHSTITHNRRRE